MIEFHKLPMGAKFYREDDDTEYTKAEEAEFVPCPDPNGCNCTGRFVGIASYIGDDGYGTPMETSISGYEMVTLIQELVK